MNLLAVISHSYVLAMAGINNTRGFVAYTAYDPILLPPVP